MSLFVLIYLRDHSFIGWIFSLEFCESAYIYMDVCMCMSFSHRPDFDSFFFYWIRDRQFWSFLCLFDDALDQEDISVVWPGRAYFVFQFTCVISEEVVLLAILMIAKYLLSMYKRPVFRIHVSTWIFLLQLRSMQSLSLRRRSWKERQIAYSQRQYIW